VDVAEPTAPVADDHSAFKASLHRAVQEGVIEHVPIHVMDTPILRAWPDPQTWCPHCLGDQTISPSGLQCEAGHGVGEGEGLEWEDACALAQKLGWSLVQTGTFRGFVAPPAEPVAQPVVEEVQSYASPKAGFFKTGTPAEATILHDPGVPDTSEAVATVPAQVIPISQPVHRMVYDDDEAQPQVDYDIEHTPEVGHYYEDEEPKETEASVAPPTLIMPEPEVNPQLVADIPAPVIEVQLQLPPTPPLSRRVVPIFDDFDDEAPVKEEVILPKTPPLPTPLPVPVVPVAAPKPANTRKPSNFTFDDEEDFS